MRLGRILSRPWAGLLVSGAALFGAPAAVAATPTIITAYAGTGASGAATPGPALSSRLGAPDGVTLDAAGELFIADALDNEVLEVTPAGTLSVFAGTGTAGPPAPGPATRSRLSGPAGVAVDAAGNVFIADTGNHEVEKVTPAGALSVFAGTGSAGTPTAGTATSSALGGPSGLAFDAAGNLYVADGDGTAGNPYVEKVTPAGALTIFAGNGTRGQPVMGNAISSPLRAPAGVTVDPSGDVLIADATANTVDEVSPSGALSLFAGRANGASGAPTAGTATNSRLNTPTGLASDATGDIFIADDRNNRIEEVTPAGRLSVLAGDGLPAGPAYGSAPTSSPLDAPFGVTVSSAGIVFVADTTNATVDRIAPTPPASSAAPTISGTAGQGQTLTAGQGTWTNSPSAFSYQWQDCSASGGACADIAGATGATDTLTAGDAGHTIRVVVTAANLGGSTSHSSAQTAIVLPFAPAITAAPTISGTATNLQTLASTPGTWSNSPSSYAYQWRDCDAAGSGCSNISGATQSTYTLSLGDVGATVVVTVTATNPGGKGTATAQPTDVIAPADVAWANTAVPSPVGSPAISGTPAVGATLSCSTGAWTGSPTGYDYQWNRSNIPLDGATDAGYTVQAADRGQTLTCTVTASNPGGAIQADSNAVAIPRTGSVSCPEPTGSLAGDRLGPLVLGDTRAQARRRLPAYTGGKSQDSFCLIGGASIRVGYAPSRLVASIARKHQAQISGRVVLALTASTYYDLDGIRVGQRLSGVPRRHRLGRALAVGADRWYVIPGPSVDALVDARNGRVVGLGIADRRLVTGRSAERRLLTSFPT